MRLQDLDNNFETDKGNEHNYIEYYNNILTPFESIESNIMEIGILRGESIRLWHTVLPKANIFAVDNFSHSTLDPCYVFTTTLSGEGEVTEEKHCIRHTSISQVKEKVTSLSRVTLIEPVDSRSPEEVNSKIMPLGEKFDVIIDDGDHSVEAQLLTFINFFPYLSTRGVYVIEDVLGVGAAGSLVTEIRRRYPKAKICIYPFNFLIRHDDVIVEVRL